MQYYAEKVTEFTLQEARRAQANQEFVQELRGFVRLTAPTPTGGS